MSVSNKVTERVDELYKAFVQEGVIQNREDLYGIFFGLILKIEFRNKKTTEEITQMTNLCIVEYENLLVVAKLLRSLLPKKEADASSPRDEGKYTELYAAAREFLGKPPFTKEGPGYQNAKVKDRVTGKFTLNEQLHVLTIVALEAN